MILTPVADGEFETTDGKAALTLAGRAGTVEWGVVNNDGDLINIGAVTSDPVPLPTADAGRDAEAPPRTAARPWPQFRGPAGSGIADGQGVPLRWDIKGGSNVRFSTPLPGIALSSPVIWEDRIYLTGALSASGDATFRTGLYGDPTSVNDLSEHTFSLYALDASSGKILWQREVHKGIPTVKRHLKSSLANASPVTDGKRVIVLFGAVGVMAAFDTSGTPLWRRDIGILDCNDPQSGVAEWAGGPPARLLRGGLQAGDRRAGLARGARRDLDVGHPRHPAGRIGR
jgi:hypothetical protein